MKRDFWFFLMTSVAAYICCFFVFVSLHGAGCWKYLFTVSVPLVLLMSDPKAWFTMMLLLVVR